MPRTASGGMAARRWRTEAQGAPITIQTATLAKVTNFRTTLQLAVDIGASAVELRHGYLNWPARPRS